MATFHWINAAGGDWGTAANWDLGKVPGAADSVIINAAGSYIVTITGADAAASLSVNAAGASVVDSGSLTLTGALSVTAGSFSLAATGVINGGTLSTTDNGFAWNGGTLNGVTYQGTLDLTASGASVTVSGGLSVTGAGGVGAGVINANGAGTSLTFIGTQTLDNVTLNLGSTLLNFDTLTIGTNAVVNQTSGATTPYDYGTSLTINGTWNDVSAPMGSVMFLTDFANNGTMNVADMFETFDTNASNTGTINVQAGGGLALFSSGTMTNSGVINDAATASIGGNIQSTAAAATLTNNGQINVTGLGGYLQIIGDISTTPGGPADVMNGTGAVNVTGNGAAIQFVGSETVQQAVFNLAGDNIQIWDQNLYAPFPGNVLQFGSQVVINQTSGSALIKDDGVAGNQVINGGVINAAAKAGIFVIQPSSFTNNGAINVSNGDHLMVTAPLGGTGSVSIAGASVAEFAGSVGTGQTISFLDGNADTLKIDAAASFAGKISGFSAGDTIDLAGLSANSAVLSNGTLNVGLTGGGSLNLAVAGNTVGAFVHTISDNSVGTDIILTASAAPPTPVALPAPVITPGVGAIGIDLFSNSQAGMAPASVTPVLTINTGTASTTNVPSAISTSSLATASDPVTGATITVGQTMSAAWTSSYTGTATIVENWSEVNSSGNSTSATYGWAGPTTSNATFSVNLANGGSYDLSWLALESGNQNFGMWNMELSVDGGPMTFVSSGTAFSATPIGDFTGTLSAGVHTLAILDTSNFFGALGTMTSQLAETFNLNITPYAAGAAPTPASYTSAGATLSVAEGSAIAAPLGSFTDSITNDVAGQFAATITWSDGTTSAGLVSGSAGSFVVTDASGRVFADEGANSAIVSVVNSADGSTISFSDAITVTEADVLTVASAPSFAAKPGQTYSGTIASFTDSYAGSSAADFSANIVWGDGTSSVGTISETAGVISVSGSHAYAAAGTDAVSVTLVDTHGTATATETGSAVITTPVAGAYTLTTHEDHLVGGAGNDVFVALTNTLSDGDVINGGGGVNTLALSGGGVFNLAVIDTLANIQIVTAQEGAGANAQSVTLRENTALTVNVASAPGVAGAGITINGADNHDVINLGAGIDTITLGVGEMVNGGGGTAFYRVNGDTISDVINGGTTGSNTLVITSGGQFSMGSNITGMTAVQLTAPASLTANGTAGLVISGSAVGGDTIRLGAASQSVISGGANEKILATAANAGAQVSGLGANSTLEITSGGTVALNAATSVTTVKLDAATNLTLNSMSLMSAVGSASHNVITAGGAYQTIGGTAGSDTLNGSAAGLDVFSAKASGLNGDVIGNFLASDKIDITNMNPFGATLKVATSGGNTQVTITSGSMKTAFSMTGIFSASGFHLANDGANGTVLTHS